MQNFNWISALIKRSFLVFLLCRTFFQECTRVQFCSVNCSRFNRESSTMKKSSKLLQLSNLGISFYIENKLKKLKEGKKKRRRRRRSWINNLISIFLGRHFLEECLHYYYNHLHVFVPWNIRTYTFVLFSSIYLSIFLLLIQWLLTLLHVYCLNVYKPVCVTNQNEYILFNVIVL